MIAIALGSLFAWTGGCGDDGDDADAGGSDAAAPDGGGMDAGPLDAGEPVCMPSDVVGCQESCQLIYDCVVRSSVAMFVRGAFPALGFAGDDFSDCSPCVTQCEAASGGADDPAVLACMDERVSRTSCAGASDPTVVIDAVDTCCDGVEDSFFCVQLCGPLQGTVAEGFFPVCRDILAIPTEPSCVGDCPTLTGTALGAVVTGDDAADFTVRHADLDASGRIAINGYVRDGSVDFGGGPIRADVGAATQYVAVFEADGTHAWSRGLTGGAAEGGAALDTNHLGNNIAFDGDGNVVLLADLFGTTDFGGGELTSGGDRDMVLVSWAPDGDFRWAVQGSGPGVDRAAEVALLDGDVWLFGDFDGSVDFGAGPLESAGGNDLVVARVSAAGELRWARRYGGPGGDPAWAIAVHPSGEHTIAGMASDGIDFGDGPVTGAGLLDWYAARFTDDGALRWKVVTGGPLTEFGYRAEPDGEAFFGQLFIPESEPVEFGGETLPDRSQTTVRLDADGEVTWLDTIEQSDGNATIVHDLAVEPDGALVVLGTISGTLDFGGGELTSEGGPDVRVTRWRADRSHDWTWRVGGFQREDPQAVSLQPSGEIVVVGAFYRVLDLGDDRLEADRRDVYVLRFTAE